MDSVAYSNPRTDIATMYMSLYQLQFLSPYCYLQHRISMVCIHIEIVEPSRPYSTRRLSSEACFVTGWWAWLCTSRLLPEACWASSSEYSFPCVSSLPQGWKIRLLTCSLFQWAWLLARGSASLAFCTTCCLCRWAILLVARSAWRSPTR